VLGPHGFFRGDAIQQVRPQCGTKVVAAWLAVLLQPVAEETAMPAAGTGAA